MSVLNPNRAFAQGILGVAVNRATDTLPQTADEALFTVAGGRVAITSIVGEVTTVIQTQANATKLKFNPDATGADSDLCGTLDITADAVGTLYSITGTPATAMQDSLLFLPPNKGLAGPLVLSEGALEIDCAASNTGSVAWTVTYVPLDDGASVVAA
jgi:hypothetical protein